MRFLALPALLITAAISPQLMAQESLNYNLVNLQAEANRVISNDLMHISMFVEKSNKQPANLASEINTLLNQAISISRKYPNVKIETGSQSTYPIYDNDNRKLKEWRGRAQVRLESKDFKAASQFMSELQQSFQVESLNFSVSEAQRKSVENELMIEASKNFQQRAQSLAQAWNKSGYNLVTINIHTNSHTFMPAPRMEILKASADISPIPEQTVAAGESTINVIANGSIQLK